MQLGLTQVSYFFRAGCQGSKGATALDGFPGLKQVARETRLRRWLLLTLDKYRCASCVSPDNLSGKYYKLPKAMTVF
ncbi:hypothetical protein Cal7507_4989 [Calothrix sp. PCC 7507]|nr:hypothetical protein Cal7507_4989 [Calothrix sp. PCC 7507]